MFNTTSGTEIPMMSMHVFPKVCGEIAMITAPYNKEGFEVLPVHQEPWVAIFPHDHPLASNADKPLTPEELLPYELLIPSRESRKSEIDRWFSHTGKAPGHTGTNRPYDERL